MSRPRRSLLVIAAVVVLALSAAAAASAEELAFNCGEDICVVAPDGTANPTDLTNTASANERFPVWSPLGDLIAYDGFYAEPGVNETWDTYTLDPAEAAPRTVTNVSQTNAFNEQEVPDWSPDGTLLAMTSRPQASNNPLKAQALVGRADGAANSVAIGSSSANEGSPRFSPAGDTVAFLREGALYTAPANGSGGPSPLSIAPYGDIWSPDGRYMAGYRLATFPYGVMITALDGSGSRELDAAAAPDTVPIEWSCDSSRVAYVADEEPADRVRVAPADDSGPGVAIPMPPGWGNAHHPTFSPDGTKVAFDALSLSTGYVQILVAPANGSAEATPVTRVNSNNEEPSWKPGPSCAGPVPPVSTPGGSAGGGGSGGSGSGGSGIAPTKAPVKLRLAYFNSVKVIGGFMTPVGINCHVEGGTPTGKVAEICAAQAAAYPKGGAVSTPRGGAATAQSAKQPLFATGKVTVPAGKSKKLRMKVTAAGLKLLKPGRKITVTLKLVTRQGSGKPVRSTRTLQVELPAKK